MYYRSKQPIQINDMGVRALKSSNGSAVINSQLVSETSSGLQTYAPALCDEGTGGTYFMKDSNNRNIAVFKPSDEDPLSPNNPKKQTVQGFSGLKAGEGVYREVLAYQLDPSMVPETCIAEVKHSMFTSPKIGSLQKFIQNAEASEEYGSSNFPVDDIHRIALLDLRIVNCDRNGENILVKRDQTAYRLIPIDHAFSLPTYTSFDNVKHFEWMNYRQSKTAMSKEMKELVRSLDVEQDVAKASALGISNDCILTLRIAHTILKKGVEANKTFFDIGKLMCSKELHNLCKSQATSPDYLLEQVAALASSRFQA